MDWHSVRLGDSQLASPAHGRVNRVLFNLEVDLPIRTARTFRSQQYKALLGRLMNT
jgi:hypothetical protein